MQLVIGGLNGFVGSNTTEALVDMGQKCVVTQHTDTEVPGYLSKHLDNRVFIESADATKVDDLRRIGEKHKIDGIVNVAGGFSTGGKGRINRLRGYFDMLAGCFQVAEEWKVKRVTMSSTAGVYAGLSPTGTVNEDTPLPLPSPFPIVTYQKIVEVAMSEFTAATGISAICVRLMGMYGPGQDPSQGFLPQKLVSAAVHRKPVNLEGTFLSMAGDEVDITYIKDIGRAIASLQLAEKLSHSVYNVGSGKVTLNQEIADTVQKLVPGFKANLPAGRSPFGLPTMDTKRLQEETGFTPKFDLQSGIKHYVEWLRAGNPK